VPWPDPNSASPYGYPLLPHELNPGDWIAVLEGAPDDPRVFAALDDHILRHTVMALPIFDQAVYSSTSGALHHNRIGSFLLRGYDIHNYLDLVYLGEADPIFCSSTATATSTSQFTATPHFSTVTPTTMSTPTESPTITLTPQGMNLYITNFYYAPASGNNVRPISLKALVVRNGLPFNQAFVNGTIMRGSVPTSVTLVSIGNGYYIVCNIGNYIGTGPTPMVSLTATDGVGNSASATNGNPTSIKFSECP
jgi:hypothetical protein